MKITDLFHVLYGIAMFDKLSLRAFGSDLAHVAWGISAVAFGQLWLFTTIFLVKQVMDWATSKEGWNKTSGDIVEYCAGIIIGEVVIYVSG